MSTAKILPLAAIAVRLEDARQAGRKVVHCHGCFDLLHIGHVRHLQAARRMGDVLVVTVTPDRYVQKGPGRPAFPEALRAEALAALDCVDAVAIDEGPTAVEAIRLIRPTYYVKGQEFEAASQLPARLHAEVEAVRAVGGELRLTHEAVYSSTALLRSHVIGDAARHFLDGVRERHSTSDVFARLDSLRDLRVLVIGETIVDEYHYCVPLGKSPKEAIVTTKYLRTERHAGGAVACANHVAGFCREVELVTGLGGEGGDEPFIRDCLRPNVRPTFFVRPDAPTITKRRYMWDPFLVKLFEIAFMDDAPIAAGLEDAMTAYLGDTLPSYDLAIVADYGHGWLSARLAAAMARGAPFLAVNTQTNAANFGFNLVTKYPSASYVCIDEPEIRLAMQDRTSAVGDLAEVVCRRLGCAAVAVTRGGAGALTCGADGVRWEVPAVSRAVVDRTGAGDAYLAVTAPCVASGMPLDMVALIGSAAGAIAVQVVGNRSSVEPADLRQLVATLLE